jgi:hypothetical protein
VPRQNFDVSVFLGKRYLEFSRIIARPGDRFFVMRMVRSRKESPSFPVHGYEAIVTQVAIDAG